MTLAEQQERQDRIAAWLADPATHGGAPVERLGTHAARVFLAGERAYKMKRVLDVGWMDFSSLAKREATLRRELALNRRTAPDLYRRVLPVTAEGEGFALDGAGEVQEWLLEMRRFPQEERFDRLLAAGALTTPLLLALADVVAAAHRAAEIRAIGGGHAGMARVARENDADLARAGFLPAESLRRLQAGTAQALAAGRALMEARRAAGWVRRCHGDLHLANIVRWQGRPQLFDCIEFSEAIGTVDLLYDLAFLLMDLERHGRRDLANLVLNRWLEGPLHLPGLALLPLFLSLRAGVRAKVTALGSLHLPAAEAAAARAESAGYLERALAYLRPAPPRLVAVGGLSGSGKSTLAAGLAPLLGAAPGALLIRSDVLRKRLFGAAQERRLPAAAYTPPWHARVAQLMLAEAAAALAAGQSVVLDAVHGFPASQAETAALAERLGLPFAGLWLEAPAEVLLERVRARKGDASDADEAVVRRQLAAPAAPTDWRRVPAGGSPATVLAAAKAALGPAYLSAA